MDQPAEAISGSGDVTCAFHAGQLFSCWGTVSQYAGPLWNKPWVVRDIGFGKRVNAVLTADGLVHTAKVQIAPPVSSVNRVPYHAPREIPKLQGLEVPMLCPAQERPLPKCAPDSAAVPVSQIRSNPQRFLNKWVSVRGAATAGSCGLSALILRRGEPDSPCGQSIVEAADPLPLPKLGIALGSAPHDLGPFCHTNECCEVPPETHIIARGVLQSVGQEGAPRYALSRANICMLANQAAATR